MITSIKYKTFTAADVKDWVLNSVSNGLSDSIISVQRAYSIINNPYVKDDDKILSVVYFDEKVIGYTAVFPEYFVKPELGETYYWGTTQWLDVNYRGKGISAKMMRIIKDAVNDKYLGLDSSIASTKLDQKQGSVIKYIPRYFFLFSHNKFCLTGFAKELIVRIRNYYVKKSVRAAEYRNNYICFIDSNTYQFICDHSREYFFLRSKEFLNWQLKYPFLVATGKDSHTCYDTNSFSTIVNFFWTKAWQVIVDKKIVGVCVLRCIEGICTVSYLYYDEEYYKNVFASVIDNMLQQDVVEVRMFSKELYDYAVKIGVKGMNSKHTTSQVSFTMPEWWTYDSSLSIQGGDGDMFE